MIDPQEFYRDIDRISKSLLPNEAKANDLRKLFEKLLHSILATDPADKHINLNELINLFVKQEKRYDLQHICHRLRQDLNTWSHHNSNKLDGLVIKDYFTRFRNLLRDISGAKDISGVNEINTFTLDKLDLNKRQEEAVLSVAKITLVNAGPGTGKTYLIVGRILEEIRKNHEKKIFGISFTNKASDELQYKIENQIYTTDLVEYKDNISTGTIHSFALNMIRQYYKSEKRTFDFLVIDEVELKDIQKEFKNDKEKLKEYLSKNKILTFDEIINFFIKMMESDDGFQKFVADKLDEIIIDEAQDLDKLQYKILYLLYQNNKNLKLFFVGDQRQNIYAFKGGSLNNILEYFKDEKDFSIVKLEHSYRCPQNILSLVNSLKFEDCPNGELHNAEGREGNKLTIEEYNDKEDEAKAIAKLIKSKQDQGVKLSEIAIIWSNTFYFKEILEALNAFKISFKVFGGQYFINPHIRLLRLILNLINTKNSYALKAIQNFFEYNELTGNDLNTVLSQLMDINLHNKENYKKLYTTLLFSKNQQSWKRLSPLDIVTNYMELTKKERLYNEEVLELFDRFKTIIENDLTLDNYDKLKLAFSPNHPEFSTFYSRSDEIVVSEFFKDKSDFVTVSTVHSAKGLQWDNVIIPGMAQDSFPRWFADDEEKRKELPNEMKKFYVACTRSKSNLYFTRPKRITIKSKKNGEWEYYTFDRSISEFVASLK